MLTFLFWLIATPVILILVGVVWLWILTLIGRVFTGGE